MTQISLNGAPFGQAAALIANINRGKIVLDFAPLKKCAEIMDRVSKTPETLNNLSQDDLARLMQAAGKVDRRLSRASKLPHFMREVVGVSRNPQKVDLARRERIGTFYESL